MLSCLTGDWAAASRWGEATFQRLDNEDPLRAAAMQLALQFGLGLTIDATRQMREAERLQAMALGEGDLGVAAYANRDRALASMRMPITLAAHRKVLAECKANAARFQDQATEPLIDALTQMALNLAEGGPEPWRLAGAVFDSPAFEQSCGPDLERVAMACMTFEALLANAYGAWETTLSVWTRMGPRFDSLKHHPVTAIWAFHCGLARARLGMPIRRWETFVVDRCARFNPVSYAHRALALKAEAQLRKGQARAAMTTYEAALVAAAQSGFPLEQGVVAVAARSAAAQIGLQTLPRFTTRKVEEQDWVRLTQSQFAPIHIGKNIWVVPSWHEAPDPEALILELDPGLAFGTGSHPTTRLCMEWLEAHPAPGKTVLDYGCGSGILAMVAKKIGAGTVAGVDIDPQAIESAKDNALRNQCEIDYFLPDSFATSQYATQRFDIVVANILSSPLKLMAPMLSGRVAEGGSLILSGVLARQAEEVAAAYAPFIKLGVWAEQDGWVALHGRLGSDVVPAAR
eukprot:gene19253-19136_t